MTFSINRHYIVLSVIMLSFLII